ncbi:YheU family protein [uncultured Porticoccus sp.]|uniref:YheU family protein n=1 Tax=uncultured Porticoccus sp. TaxID=1256050 RepID=UPI00260777D8|nr:YheU family protein [uncultured Porticoccus sp.]
MILIPPDRLSDELLTALLDDFIAREGTDYGFEELTLQAKRQRLRRQVDRGDVVITFDPVTESCNLLSRQQFRQLADSP